MIAPSSKRIGRPPTTAATLAHRRARILRACALRAPDLATAARELGITKEHAQRIARVVCPGYCAIGRNRLAPAERAQRLARIMAELHSDFPNLKAAAIDLGISHNLIGLIVRRDLGYRVAYVTAEERAHLRERRRTQPARLAA